MEKIDTTIDAPFKSCLFMRENLDGTWSYLHYPERMPLTTKQLDFLEKVSSNAWILICNAERSRNKLKEDET